MPRRLRFQEKLGLGSYEAGVLTDDRALADYYEECVAAGAASPKAVANWVINDVLRTVNERQIGVHELGCPPKRLAALAARYQA